MPDPDQDAEPDPQDPNEGQEAEWPPGEVPALEPADLPNRPLTADACQALIPKIIG
jgi:hypothetical protein